MTSKQVERFAEKLQKGIVCYDSVTLPNIDDCKGKFIYYKIDEVCYISCKHHFDVFFKSFSGIEYKKFNFSKKDSFYLRLLLK